MGPNFEVERKFLIKTFPPDWKLAPHFKIIQGYLPLRSKDLQMRLRLKNEKFYLTVKNGSGGSRQEEEIEIPKPFFELLWPLTKGKRIAKTRYEIPHKPHTIELDVFEGPHRGLITAEVEFTSKKASRAFKPPGWLGREITGSRRYANRQLAKKQSAF
ncbi:MAG: CYTH domain-containing protein [Limisphaerales bacterium]